MVENGAGDPVAGALLFVVRRRGRRGARPTPLGLLGRGGGRPGGLLDLGPFLFLARVFHNAIVA